MRGIFWLAAKTGQLLKKDSAPWSKYNEWRTKDFLNGRGFVTQCVLYVQSICYPGRSSDSREIDSPPTTTGFSGHNEGFNQQLHFSRLMWWRCATRPVETTAWNFLRSTQHIKYAASSLPWTVAVLWLSSHRNNRIRESEYEWTDSILSGKFTDQCRLIYYQPIAKQAQILKHKFQFWVKTWPTERQTKRKQ
jgi:hypothetical protein